MTSQPNATTAQSISLFWVCVLAVAWILPGLIGHDPWKPDEAYTFGVVYDLLRGGDWVVPSLAQEPFLDRPPLYYLTAAALASLLSWLLPLHDAARLVTGLYMGLTLLFIGLAAREWYGRGHGRLAVLTLLGCFGLVVRCHQLIADVGLLTGMAAAFYGLAVAARRPAWGGGWFGTGLGIAFLSKGLIAPAMLILLALLLPLFPAWRSRQYWIWLATAALAAMPWLIVWPLLLYDQSPALFDQWLWTENISAFLGDSNVSVIDRSHYLNILPWYGLPAWPLAAWALWRARHSLAEPKIGVPLAGFLVILALLSASADTRELYALPLLLPLTLLATPATDSLRRGGANLIYWFSVMGGGFFLLVAWFYWGALELGWPPRLHQHLQQLQPGYVSGFKPLAFAFGVLYTGAWIAVLATLKRGPQRALIAWAASATLAWGLTAILFSGPLDAGKSYRSLAAGLEKALPAKHGCIASHGLGDSQRAMLYYFAGIVTWREEVEERQRDCPLLLVQGTIRTADLPEGKWRKIWESARPGDKVERYRLYRRIR